MQPCRTHNTIRWIFQIATAAVLAGTLFLKLTAAQESVYFFTTPGLEPWRRSGL